MSDVVSPVHQATVLPEVGRLLAAWRGRLLRRHTSVSPQTAAPEPDEPSNAPWLQLVLRRDGARPLKVRGLLVHSTEVRTTDGRGLLRLFATEDGAAVAQLAYEPGEDVAARPVFRAQPVRDADELKRFIDCRAPEQAAPGGKDRRRAERPASLPLPWLPPIPLGPSRPEHLRLHSCEGNRS